MFTKVESRSLQIITDGRESVEKSLIIFPSLLYTFIHRPLQSLVYMVIISKGTDCAIHNCRINRHCQALKCLFRFGAVPLRPLYPETEKIYVCMDFICNKAGLVVNSFVHIVVTYRTTRVTNRPGIGYRRLVI